MAEDHDRQYRRRIVEILNRSGFAWIVNQAEVQIAEGKLASKQISERELSAPAEDLSFVIRRPHLRRASLITTEPYTERERLDILLHGIEAAIVQRSAIEQEVLRYLRDVTEIRFEPDLPTEASEETFGAPHRIDHGRQDVAKELEFLGSQLLQELRRRDDDGT